ncbi:MAG: sigma-70 family RNA polymerase sigma factor [Chloroflexi bacterium]|nr:sigma-70 family RNA polymerase sigma factor [Chloroflexota bacterium]
MSQESPRRGCIPRRADRGGRCGRSPQILGLTDALGAILAAPHSEQPESAAARTSVKETVEAALRRLAPRLREAVVLRYGHGLTYREIAEVMDCPQKTAESRVRLAHEALRGLLTPAGASLLEELWMA